MAKPELRRTAMTLFVEQDKTRKEIADLIGVREKTVGDWAREGRWESLREQRLTSSESVITNLKELMSSLAQQRLALQRDKNSDPGEKARLTDELSKVSKSLSEAKGENDLTLNARLKTLEWAFNHMRKEKPELHNSLVDVHLELIEEAARLHA